METIIYIGILIVLAGIIALEMRIPVAIMEIIFGVLAFNILGLTTDSWIEFMANLGVLGIMFFAGLEIDPNVLKRDFLKSSSTGALIYLCRLTIVFVVAFLLFGYNPYTSLLIGISLSTTSLALVYPIVKERGSIKTDYGQAILSVAMVIDILSTISLIFFVQPEHEAFLAIYIVISFLIFLFAPKVTKKIFARYGGNIAEIEVRFILLFLVAAGFLAEKLMLSEVIFAFFLGLIFSEILTDRKDVEEKLRGIIFGFLAPVFFFKAGMLMDLRSLSMDVLFFILVFGTIAYLSVYLIAKHIFARWFGPEIGKCTGLIFNFRLSFGIIAAIFGLRMGLITVPIYTGIVTIILLASVVSSILLKFIPPPRTCRIVPSGSSEDLIWTCTSELRSSCLNGIKLYWHIL